MVVPHFLERDKTAPVVGFPVHGYALFIGRLSPEKGVARLLEAWAKLAPTRRLVIAGDGPELAALQAQARALSLTNVTFVGFVGRAAQSELWAGAAFSIVPSRWQEPFGMVVLEAWSQGRSVVAHRIGALPEIITDKFNGFLADPDDADDLAAVVETAFEHGPVLRDMGQNGLATLLSYYNKSRWLNDIKQVYQHAGL